MTPLLLLLFLAKAEGREVTSADRAAAYHHFSLGLQSRLAGDYEVALTELRRAQKLDPTAPEPHVEAAKLLIAAGRMKDALPEAEAGVRLGPRNSDAHLVLGQLHQSQIEERGEAAVRAAADAYDKALEHAPAMDATLVRILYTIGAMRGQLEQPAEAVKAWKRYVEIDGTNVDAYLQLGKEYLALGDSEHAAQALQRAVELQPTSSRAYHALAEIFATAQQVDQAVLNYRKALELEPGNIRVHLELGDILLRASRPKEALTEAEAVIAADPKSRHGLELKGRAMRDLRRFDEAKAVAAQLLAEDPKDLKAIFLNVTILEAARDFEAAVKALEAVLARTRTGEGAAESGSNDRLFLVHLGVAHQQLGHHREAADALARALATGGEPDASLLEHHAQALLLAKDLDQALTAVRAARAKFPDDADLATLEANVLRARGDVKGGTAIIDALKEKKPRDPEVLLAAADFYRKARRLTEAEAALREALALQPRHLPTLFQLGAVLERQKRHDAAEGLFREALAVQPDSAPILNYLGYMNADRGVRVPEALTLIEKAVSLDPENGAYLDSLGWALFRLKRYAEAESYLRRAVAKGEPNAVVFDHFGDVLRERGALPQALEHWRKALVAEDEEQELDRTAVERKIREVQASLDDPSQRKLP